MNYEIKTFIYENLELEVKTSIEEQNVWLTTKQMSQLFKKTERTIYRMIQSKVANSSFEKLEATSDKMSVVQQENGRNVKRKITYYNLTIITLIGYDLNPLITFIFEGWCNKLFNKNESFTSNVITFSNNGIKLDVNVSPEENTVYLTQNQMSVLFNIDVSSISRHIANIFNEGELDEGTSLHFLQISPNETTPNNRPPAYYNLDVIISVGYRVNSQNGVIFRKWATGVLREYLLKGYVVNDSRVFVTKENYTNLVNHVMSIDTRLDTIEEDIKELHPRVNIIKENHPFDGIVFIDNLVLSASKSLVLIDSYLDRHTLNAFTSKRKDVPLFIITEKSKLTDIDIEKYIEQCGELKITFDDTIHDRYLIIDEERYYHLGTSINFLGNKFSEISLEKDECIINLVREKINILK